MKLLKKVTISLYILLISLGTAAKSYHFEEGFDLEGAANSVPAGWITAETYPTNGANHGRYLGDRCIKFNNSKSYLITPVTDKAVHLSFWVILLDDSDGKEQLHVEVKRGGGDFEVIQSYKAVKNDFTKGAWKEFIINIDEASAYVQVRFSSVYGEAMRTLCIDDVSLSYPTSEDAPDDREYSKRYYIDATNGDDSNSGKSELKAWKTLSKVNAKTLSPGDTVLLKCNNEWNEVFQPKGSGNINSKIVITSYGKGLKPIINAQGRIPSTGTYSASISLYNQAFWKIENVAIKNNDATETEATKKYGILVYARNIGTLKGFHINNIEVSEVNGIMDMRENGGLGFVITGVSTPTNFDGILVENSYFHDLSNCGVFTESSWKNRDFSSKFGETASNGKENTWYPSHNIVIRHNRFERSHGNGMVIRIADGPLVEHNTFYMCGLKTTGNASYPYNCDNALWQFNEASHTVYNQGDVDASGFDSDYFCKNTIIQYNYSHDNDWGSVLVCCQGSIERAFNDGTIVRYNVFQNDGHHMIRMSGKTTNTYIYNNVFYVSEQTDGMELLWHKSWNGYSDNTSYANNIFYNKGTNTTYDFTQSTNNLFSNNVFYGNRATNEPNDPNKIVLDPMFVDPGNGGFGFGTTDGYQVQPGSPAIGAGKRMTLESITDFYGNEILPSNITIGAYQGSSSLGIKDDQMKQFQVKIVPNPVDNYTTLDIYNRYRGKIYASIITLGGICIRQFEFNKNSELVSRVLSLDELQTGTYLLQINAGDELVVKKIMKVDS